MLRIGNFAYFPACDTGKKGEGKLLHSDIHYLFTSSAYNRA